MNNPKELTKINVYIQDVIYTNEENDFYIYSAHYNEKLEHVSIKTTGFKLPVGDACLVGYKTKYFNNRSQKWENSFDCKYQDTSSLTREQQKNLLCTIKGIKEKTIEKIFEGIESEDVLSVLRSDKVPKIKGIGDFKMDSILTGLKVLDSQIIFRDLNILIGNKAHSKVLNKIAEEIKSPFTDTTLESFKENPYITLIDGLKMNFKKADAIALQMGISKKDLNRAKYYIESLVIKSLGTGNCFIKYDDLLNQCKEMKIDKFYDLKEIINNNERLVIEDEKVYLKNIYEAETGVAENIQYFLNDVDTKYQEEDLNKIIEKYENNIGFKLADKQKESMIEVMKNDCMIITGGAGCGKTTVLKGIVNMIRNFNYSPVIMTPTGKASRRATQATGCEASTIHSYLWNVGKSSGNVCIIDETSMVDIMLFNSLLKRLKECNFKKLIIVGDPNQLQSVQAGNVLLDLIESKIIKTIKLNKTFRQGEDSNIIKNANEVINQKTYQPIKKKDFFVREHSNNIDFLKSLKQAYTTLQNKFNNIDEFYSQVQIICPTKGKEVDITSNKLTSSDIKVHNINHFIKMNYNPKIKNKYEFNTQTGEKKKVKDDFFPYSIDDKIMNLENDKENGIFNGECGRVTAINQKTFTVHFYDLGKDCTFQKNSENINRFMLAYCSTVHKMQGSEYKYVLLVLSEDSSFIDSQLLYTAITRAKETLFILQKPSIQDKIVLRKNSLKRNTYLKERLQA